MAGIIYNLIIRPLEFFFQFIYGAVYGFVGNYGISIIFLSIAVNLLLFPLYNRADAIQKEEQDLQKKMEKWVTHIKNTFSGDERYMMISTYYRQNHYSSIYALRGSISLFLQIPFFIAAYRFLSGYTALQGVSFGPVSDLSRPDGIIRIGGIVINLLPVLMTAINIVSGSVYSKGMAVKTKVQLYGMALFFLVFLYRSPSGLVFYWTLNNLFSLIKNIFYKIRNPRRVIGTIALISGAGLILAEVSGVLPHTVRQKIAVISAGIVLIAVGLFQIFNESGITKHSDASNTGKKENAMFFIAGFSIAALVGLLIPSAVISASPEEFVNEFAAANPNRFLVQPFLTSVGVFVVWLGVFFWVSKKETKHKFVMLLTCLLFTGMLNYMFFGKGLGNFSPELVFEESPVYMIKNQIINMAIVLLTIAIILFLWKKKPEIIRIGSIAVLIGVCGLSFININKTNRVYAGMSDRLESIGRMPEIPISRSGKNIMVLMLDRAISGYLPYIFKEKPELRKQFDGFTYYPNTISYGPYTNFGAPALFGGYDYTPEQINRRADEKLVDKHNEALRVMPKLFDENGFEVTVCDPPYAGYTWIPDLTIYDDLPNTHAYRLSGRFADEVLHTDLARKNIRKRNFFFYGIFKISPECFQHFIYDGGKYFNPPAEKESIGDSQGFAETFINEFTVLTHLNQMTHVNDTDKNTFLMFQNCTTHQPVILQKPEYELKQTIDNEDFDREHDDYYEINGEKLVFENEQQKQHYCINMAALMQLGNWFDYLRSQEVFDNTRIIITADHGRGLNQIKSLQLDKLGFDGMWLNPLLMVKDFNSDKFGVSNEFMTNADVPSLASETMIKDPVNPFTDNPINMKPKQGKQHVVFSDLYNVNENNGTQFDTSDGQWYSVERNIFDQDNWEKTNEKK